ncbi:MAG TPA: hypothetical protein PKD80_15475 [Microthrixaceae bacterium]|nr:hypothetical protein [Microthrixaceae bacterium]HMT23599.1 hypothetical protein [Microthrixaceae bacterium]
MPDPGFLRRPEAFECTAGVAQERLESGVLTRELGDQCRVEDEGTLGDGAEFGDLAIAVVELSLECADLGSVASALGGAVARGFAVVGAGTGPPEPPMPRTPRPPQRFPQQEQG